jgi:hypothetical protein
MKLPRFLSSVLASIVLSSCASAVKPYSSEQEAWRVDVREGQQSELRRLYEQGLHDGRFDAAEHQGPRHVAYVTAAEKAYGDGYREGYGAAGEPVRDEAYNQGFDYGMRDRARKRPSDPEAHIGDYDARFRLSFERGYLDGYNR